MMAGGNGDAVESSGSGGVAPFVAKTYGMVDDPATDGAVAWGAAGNSFVVADPSGAFSRALLPARFGHANFASFVRQLNTYGFRKVHPDRWEFAHASFLRGQTHLLRHVVRRRSNTSTGKGDSSTTTLLAVEVVRLKQEQRATEERLAAMWRRVQETERRPKLTHAFLLKAAGDPDALRRLAGDFHGGPADEGAGAKRPRLLLDDGEAVQLAAGNKTMSSVDGAGVDALLYEDDIENMQEEVFAPEPSSNVGFTGPFYAGADGFCDVLMDDGAFPVDSGGY